MDVTHHKLSSQELANYLQRIHLVSPPKATDIDGLTELQNHHLLSIPYENLDPMNGISTSMDSEDLYKKMILHRRGGYCFELQGLFLLLLTTLVYHVQQLAGRIMDATGIVQMRRHRVLIVTIDSIPWLTDVGVNSESPRQPIRIHGNRSMVLPMNRRSMTILSCPLSIVTNIPIPGSINT